VKAFRSQGKYTWNGEEYPSVTTILSVIAKPALVYWAGKVVAEEAVRRVSAGEELDVRSLASTPNKRRGDKADVGSIVHSVLEAYADGEQVAPEQVPSDARSYVCSLREWLAEHNAEVLHSEATVIHQEPRYAGTVDAVMRLNGKTLLVDVKTGKGVYKEAGLQLAAYRYADFIGYADGSSEKMPEVDGAMVLHVTPDGTTDVPFPADRETHKVFLAALTLWEYVNQK